MGRPEKPILTPNSGLFALAQWLRDQRTTARLTYTALAETTIYTATTLQRATNGERIPKLPVVEAYARGCGADVKAARKLWRNARWIEHRTLHPRLQAARPELVTESAELLAALRELYYKSGGMPLDEIERRAGIGRPPHTTVHRMLHGATVLQLDQLRAFLQVCEVPDQEHEAWVKAWLRLWRQREQQRQECLADKLTVDASHVRVLGSDGHVRSSSAFSPMERTLEEVLDHAVTHRYRVSRQRQLRAARVRDILAGARVATG